MGRIGSGVRVSANFQIFALRTLLHSVRGFTSREAGNISLGLYTDH